MSISTMAIACRPDNASSGPAVSALLSGVIDSIETHTGDISLPTHLGFGVRFDLNSSNQSMPGKNVDVSCRIDLVSIELGSSGDEPVHPTPAVHLDAHLWEQDWTGSQSHLLGSPESPTRLRSVEMHLGWHTEEVDNNGTMLTESVWDASLVLNDAAFQNHMDWPAAGDSTEYLEKIPGRLVIDGMSSATGAMECLGEFITDYAEQEAEDAFESFLGGLTSLGIATKLDYDSLDPSSIWDDLPWTLDQPAIQTFLSDPLGYLSNLIHDPLGDVDLSLPLPYGDLSILQALSNLIPGGRILDDPMDVRHGALLFDLPLPFSETFIHLHLTPAGLFGLNTDSLSLGPFDMYTSMDMPLLSPDEWGDGPSISVTLQAAPHVSGMLNGCALILARNSPWTLTLDLPDSGVVPCYDTGSFQWIQPPNEIVLSDPGAFDDLLTYVPGMILDSVLSLLVERLLSPRIGDTGVLGTLLSELNLVTWDSYGEMSANSIFPLLHDPQNYLVSCFTNTQGLDSESILNVADSLLGLLPSEILSYNSAGELMVGDVIGPVSRIVLPISVFELSLQESVTPGSLTLMLATSDDLEASLSASNVDLDVEILLNLHSDFSIDMDGSHIDVDFAVGNMISSLDTSGGGIFAEIANALSSAEAGIHASMNSGTVNLSVEVDFDPLDSSPAAILNLLPTVGGIDVFLQQLVSSLVSAILPDIIEFLVRKLDSVNVYDPNDGSPMVTLDTILIDILETGLDVWDDTASPTIDMAKFQQLCSGPAAYLSSNLLQLLNVALTHISGLFADPADPDPFFSFTQMPASSPTYTQINVSHSTVPAWLNDISLNFGIPTSGLDSGVWIAYEPSISVGLGNIEVCAEVGAYRDSNGDWDFGGLVSAYTDAELISSPFILQPAIQFGYSAGSFYLLISTVVDSGNLPSTGSDAFWIRVLPTDQFDWGMPDLSVLLMGAADNALNFIDQNANVQEFLATPLYPSGPDWKQALSNLTIVGDWLVHLGVCTYGTSPGWATNKDDPAVQPIIYNIRNLQEIIDHYVPASSPYSSANNGFEILLRGAMGMVGSVITGNIPIFECPELSGLVVSLNVEDDGSYKILGINVDIEPFTLPIGNLQLTFSFRDPGDDFYSDWTSEGYIPGITMQLLKWNTAASPLFDDHFCLKIGHLAVNLGKSNMQPMLDGFILLNAVTVTTCIEMMFSGGFQIEAGGRLDLDDFGLSLGGNGSEDGGNSLAAGTLDGGEGKEAVRPTFDLAIWKYGSNSVDVEIRGGLEYWFPINKQFGPIKISQIGVRYEPEDSDGDEHRLSILIDGEAEIAGFLAQVDDLSVSMPILDLFNFSDWKYDMAGCAISYTGPAIEIAGALRKTVITDTSDNEYIEYQGLCTIKTSTMAISAIGAFGRVPVTDGDSYVTCFVIAALDMPLGGPPMFFVTGLLGGLGLNRELYVPDISQVPSSPFMLAMDGFGSDPMGALESIRTHLPAERGSFWFAIGVKFTTFQVIESKAVLYIKISNDDFAVGLIGLSAMSLPTPELNIGYIELAFAASYDSGTNIFRAEAQLTDASYLFSKSCRLTGGFALVNWFNRGDFLLSIGGYHPKFKVPPHYPAVPRLGFNWKPISKLVIKGGAYFTVCSSAVMLGGSFEASYKSGCLSASFRAGVDVLIVFDPFFYSFRVYIGVSVRLKTWLGTLKASLGADLEIEGPKMRGTARIEIVFVSFTVKFGSNQKGSPQPISGKEFMNKHILQRPEGEFNHSFSNLFEEQFALAQPVKGLIRSSDEDSPDEDEAVNGPFNLEMEFEFAFSHPYHMSIKSRRNGQWWKH
ncbi:MAG: hypothetical protein CXX81_07435, partial [Methanobacteriota archaeon]